MPKYRGEIDLPEPDLCERCFAPSLCYRQGRICEEYCEHDTMYEDWPEEPPHE